MSRRALLTGLCLAALGAWLTGCAGIGWGSGLSADRPPSLEATQSGLVVVLGPEAFAAASEDATDLLLEDWPHGLTVSGDLELSPDIGLPGLTVTGFELIIDILAVELVPSTVGIEVRLSAYAPPTILEIMHGGGDTRLCSSEVGFDRAELVGHVRLDRDKLGRVSATLLEDVELVVTEPRFHPGACKFTLSPTAAEEAAQQVLDWLAEQAMTLIGPGLAAVLPEVLGLDLALAATEIVADDGVGSGSVSMEVRAPEASGEIQFWSFADGLLTVHYSVGLEGERHACVPAHDVDEAWNDGVPLVTDTALLVNTSVAVRAVRLLWAAGRMCGDRASRGVELPVEQLAAVWPELERLGPAPVLSFRMWPGAEPRVAFEAGQEGVELRLEADDLSVELLGEVDGAVLTLASIVFDADFRGPLVVDADGTVRADPERVSVVVTNGVGTAALLPAPQDTATVAEALAEAVLGGRQLWQLPPLPIGPLSSEVELRDDSHLVFPIQLPEPPGATPAGD